MNEKIRTNLVKKILEKAQKMNKNVPINPNEISYKHCKIIADFLGENTHENTIAHLFGVSSYKLTQTLKPELEQRIAVFLGFDKFTDLEDELMRNLVLQEFLTFINQK
ncbi:MAG: hypothetical protein EAZ85_07940 [Bacteroidetes bacterium]|nr:MAG: hypothetical protein EAZ85_07940 [Bacteroidota bacterium]